MPRRAKDREVEVWIPAPPPAGPADSRLPVADPLLLWRGDRAVVHGEVAASEFHIALGVPTTQPAPLRASKLEAKVREMAELLSDIAGDLHLTGVRPDSVSFSFTVGTDGAVKWIMGAKVEGSASITFKFDGPKGAQD